VPSDGADFEGSGLQAKATLGYEMFRASTIRLLLQADAILPMYRLSRTTNGLINGLDVETKSHTYAPNLMFSLGLGWGSSSE
jgi:hypothetical protein